ncbi:MAG: hypothetical protein JWM61_3148 [Micrococcaceae bacterium]|nr:hypothetical protein [Micrococcaceae bacterium]
MKIDYARASANEQDPTAQRNCLVALGVALDDIDNDHRRTGQFILARVFAKRWQQSGEVTPSLSLHSTTSHVLSQTLAEPERQRLRPHRSR